MFTASSSSYNERPNLPLYSIAKHGVLALMRSLRSLGPPANFHVGAVAPGGTATNMVGPAIAARMEAVGIVMQPAEYVALGLVTLASDPARNGMCYAMLGHRCFEIEGKVRETMPLWYGEWNTEQALKGALVNFTGAGVT